MSARHWFLAVVLLALAAPAEAITVTLRHPAAAGTLYAGVTAAYLNTYFAADTDVLATCRIDTSNVAYASMDGDDDAGSNPATWTNTTATKYHTHRIALNAGSYTFYYACQEDGNPGNTSATASVSFTADTTTNTIAGNLTARALSDTTAIVRFSQTNGSATNYRIYRDSVQTGPTRPSNPDWEDTGLTPNTLYWYTATFTLGGIEQTASPPVPMRTLPTLVDPDPAAAVILDDFESGTNRLAEAGGGPLWTTYPPPPGNAANTVVVGAARTGTYGLRATISAGTGGGGADVSPYVVFQPWLPDGTRLQTYEYLASGTWARNTYNRMRLWVKVPEVFDEKYIPATAPNCEFGTFVRSSTAPIVGSAAEESGFGGDHYYHGCNVAYNGGVWTQIVLDPHFNHIRSGPSMDFNGLYPTGEPTWNYMDGLNRWYINFDGSSPALDTYPSDFDFDDVEFFQEAESVSDIENVFALSMSYNPDTHHLYIYWNRRVEDDVTKHDLKYAFESIRDLGWASATTVPGTSGGYTPLTFGPYNQMFFDTTAINADGEDIICIAIQSQGATGFREICNPTTGLPPDPPDDGHSGILLGAGGKIQISVTGGILK